MLILRRIILPLLLVAGLSSSVVAAELIDINVANVAELSTGLKGIGEQKAAAIVAYRETHGPFTSVDDLQNVKGIGATLVEKLRNQLTVVTPTATPKKTE